MKMYTTVKNQADSSSVPHQPYLPDVGMINLVADDWEKTAWRRRQQILTRLSQYMNVIWCNPPRSWRRFLRCDLTPATKAKLTSNAGRGMIVYQPEWWLPGVGRPAFLARWTMKQRLNRARRLLLARGCQKTILCIWRPEYASALDLLDYDLSCYQVDDEYTFSEVEKPMDEWEAGLISRVDQVFIHSPGLLETKGKLNPETLFVPNGVDYYAYAAPCSEPADLMTIPHPRIGYVGIIKKQLDIVLLHALARRHPQWSFVLVGPQGNLGGQAVLFQQLSRLPNVYCLGYKPFSALPSYTQHLDVCVLCYEVNDYTKFIYPLKLHEYLASGRPVVGSRIRSLEDYAHVIRLARTGDEWSHALQDSLAPDMNAPARVEERQGVARRHDWERLAWMTAYYLCKGLGPSYLEKFMENPLSRKHADSQKVDESPVEWGTVSTCVRQ